MSSFRVLAVVFALVGCSNAEMVDRRTQGSSADAGATGALRAEGDGVGFQLAGPPSVKPVPVGQQLLGGVHQTAVNRQIELSCEGPGRIAMPLGVFELRVREHHDTLFLAKRPGDSRRLFAFDCDGPANVRINGLPDHGGQYEIFASFYSGDGDLLYEGAVGPFSMAEVGHRSLQLTMRRADRPRSLDLQIFFDDSDEPRWREDDRSEVICIFAEAEAWNRCEILVQPPRTRGGTANQTIEVHNCESAPGEERCPALVPALAYYEIHNDCGPTGERGRARPGQRHYHHIPSCSAPGSADGDPMTPLPPMGPGGGHGHNVPYPGIGFSGLLLSASSGRGPSFEVHYDPGAGYYGQIRYCESSGSDEECASSFPPIDASAAIIHLADPLLARAILRVEAWKCTDTTPTSPPNCSLVEAGDFDFTGHGLQRVCDASWVRCTVDGQIAKTDCLAQGPHSEWIGSGCLTYNSHDVAVAGTFEHLPTRTLPPGVTPTPLPPPGQPRPEPGGQTIVHEELEFTPVGPGLFGVHHRDRSVDRLTFQVCPELGSCIATHSNLRRDAEGRLEGEVFVRDVRAISGRVQIERQECRGATCTGEAFDFKAPPMPNAEALCRTPWVDCRALASVTDEAQCSASRGESRYWDGSQCHEFAGVDAAGALGLETRLELDDDGVLLGLGQEPNGHLRFRYLDPRLATVSQSSVSVAACFDDGLRQCHEFDPPVDGTSIDETFDMGVPTRRGVLHLEVALCNTNTTNRACQPLQKVKVWVERPALSEICSAPAMACQTIPPVEIDQLGCFERDGDWRAQGCLVLAPPAP